MIKNFVIKEIGRIVRSGGETTSDYPTLALERKAICNGCDKKGAVDIGFSKVEACDVCSCPLITKTKTLFHRDYRNKIDWSIKNLIAALDKKNVPFIRTQCDLGKWEEVDKKHLGIKKIIQINMAIVNSIGDFGKKRANTDACPTNAVRLDACNCVPQPSCLDEIVIPEAEGKTIVSYNFAGKEHTTYRTKNGESTLTAPANGENKVCDGLYELVRNHENKVFVDARLIDGSTHISHIGEYELKSVTLSDGTVIEATRKCDLGCECTYQGNTPAAQAKDVLLVITDKDGNEVLNKVVPGEFTEANAENATAYQEALNTCLAENGTATVTLDPVSGAYITTILSNVEGAINLGEKTLGLCGCIEKFYAAKEEKEKKTAKKTTKK